MIGLERNNFGEGTYENIFKRKKRNEYFGLCATARSVIRWPGPGMELELDQHHEHINEDDEEHAAPALLAPLAEVSTFFSPCETI